MSPRSNILSIIVFRQLSPRAKLSYVCVTTNVREHVSISQSHSWILTYLTSGRYRVTYHAVITKEKVSYFFCQSFCAFNRKELSWIGYVKINIVVSLRAIFSLKAQWKTAIFSLNRRKSIYWQSCFLLMYSDIL